MKKYLRFLAFFVALIMIVLPISACEKQEDSSDGNNVSLSEDDGFFGYHLPDGVNYDGRVLYVLTTAAGKTATCYQVDPESNPDYTGELSAVQQAAKESIELVEELLNVEIEEECIFTSSRYGGPMYQRISRDIISNTGDYIFAMPCLNEAAMLASDGLLYDLNTVVDLENPWWCQPFNEAVTIAGKCYFATGDIGTVSKESTMFVAFNKEIEAKNHLAESYGYSSLYEMVDKKAWTHDVMFEMAKTVYVDTNQNNIADPDDMVGLSAQENVVYWLLRSGNINVCTLDDEGYPELTINNERAISLITDAQEYVQSPDAGLIIADDYSYLKLPINPATQAFIDGNCLFYFNGVSNLNTIRVMEDDFGVLPCPLYDETQENYSNNVGSWTSNCVCLPTFLTEEDLELAGHILEALGAVNRAKLTPVFFEQTLQYQISRDDDSMRMLEIIDQYRSPDLSEMYRWGSMMQTIASMRNLPVGTFVSQYEKIENKTIADIEATVNTFKENNH